jgi:hypothetical protein
MTLPGGDFYAFAFMENEIVIFDFHGQLAFENVEELAGVDVGMEGFLGTWGHEFFDNAKFGRLDQVPAVAIGCLGASPFIVFGGLGANYFCGHAC